MTWSAGAVKRRPLCAYTMQCSLCDGILLRVKRAYTATILKKTADIRAVGLPRRRTVVSGA